MIAAEIRNTIPTKGRKVWKAEDFMPARKQAPPKPMTTEQTVAYVETLNRLLGGVDLRGLDG